MNLSVLDLSYTAGSPFQEYLLNNQKLKKTLLEFEFYDVKFYSDGKAASRVYLQYPKGNPYWYKDFEKALEKFTSAEYESDWKKLMSNLHDRIHSEMLIYKAVLNASVTPSAIVETMLKYQLRDYQACDLLQFVEKYRENDNKGLILSEPRTGKTRVALAALAKLASPGDVALVICPKSAEAGWVSETKVFDSASYKLFDTTVVTKISDLKRLELNPNALNVRIISYELFKKLKAPTQLRELTNNSKHITMIGDEIHRLRNFKTQQSKAIFDFKEFCSLDKVQLGIIGMTGTPAVKDSSDVFGILSLINDSKIQFRPYYKAFDEFKEYFYYCEDTSFGKQTKALKRSDELNYILQTCSVQTKQRELDMFKGYEKRYRKVELSLDEDQKRIYDSVYDTMEYDEDIDCQNKLVQLIRLQQICIDPFGLVSSYARLSPKLKWVCMFAMRNKTKAIVAAKKVTPLNHLSSVLDKLNIPHSYIKGSLSYSERLEQVAAFTDNPDNNVLLMQLDTGREALTISAAQATIFLDRDFAQGFNEQAEARMTPVDGTPCVKYVIDLIMKDTKEESIYDTLVIRKKSIDAVNTVFKPRKEIRNGI